MMFIDEDDYAGPTNYQASLPRNLQHLLLPGFMHQYVKGPWGSYLSLWIETEDFEFWIQYIWRTKRGKMYAEVRDTIYTLHHLLEGRVFGELNGSMPVELSADWSHFFVIPGGMRQRIFMNKGNALSMHIDFKREYLERNSHHYKALQPILDKFDQYPNQAFHEMSVQHNYLLEHPWKKVLKELPSVANPVLYLEAQARELLRMHYEKLEEKTIVKEYEANPDKVTAVQARAAYKLRMILEKNISHNHRTRELARKVGLNEFELKRLFKEVYKTTIHQYLLQLRMQAAKEELLTTQNPIAEVAMECGFNNAAHFSHHFKKVFGISPGDFRKRKKD